MPISMRYHVRVLVYIYLQHLYIQNFCVDFKFGIQIHTKIENFHSFRESIFITFDTHVYVDDTYYNTRIILLYLFICNMSLVLEIKLSYLILSYDSMSSTRKQSQVVKDVQDVPSCLSKSRSCEII